MVSPGVEVVRRFSRLQNSKNEDFLENRPKIGKLSQHTPILGAY